MAKGGFPLPNIAAKKICAKFREKTFHTYFHLKNRAKMFVITEKNDCFE